MDRIGLVGISWRAGVPAFAPFVVPREERARLLLELRDRTQAEELVYLATCNRVEVAFVAPASGSLRAFRPLVFRVLAGRDPQPGEAERALRAWAGEGAVEHLFCVTAGLDSARLGETDITGQVREAVELARATGVLGVRFDPVFEEAFKVAARIHGATPVAKERLSLGSVAVEHALACWRESRGEVALLGVSALTERCAAELASHGVPVLVVNRTPARAEALAARTGGQARAQSLAEFRERPPAVAAVIAATGAPEPVLARAHLERLGAQDRSGGGPLLLDLGVPANISAADARSTGLRRLGMEEFLEELEATRRTQLLGTGEAHALIDAALERLREKLVDRTLAPVLAAVQGRYRETALRGIERLFQRELKCLGETERAAVRRWAETLARRFAHLPSEGLRGVARRSGMAAVLAFLERGDPELAAGANGHSSPVAVPPALEPEDAP